MKFIPLYVAVAAISLQTAVFAHPERHDASQPAQHLAIRSTSRCASAIEARRAHVTAKRSQRLFERRMANRGVEGNFDLETRNVYTQIQNDTCVLAPDTVWGPYGVDGEMMRHDLRESQEGLDFYFDIGLIDIETCEPLSGAAIVIWNCNATGSYSSYTGIDPNTADLLSGWTKRADGTTDDETFLRGIQLTDDDGMVEFLTKFPGYYISRTTHIHLTVQSNITNGTSYNASAVQHIGQLFFEESLLNQIYQLSPYSAHLATLNRTTNLEDKLFSTASSDGYSAIVSVSQLGTDFEDGIVGYITVGVNASAAGLTTTGGSVNEQGYIPTVSIAESKKAEATAIDVSDGYVG